MTKDADLPRKVLVANRGEIACRVLRTLDRLGVPSVAVYSDADAGAPHVRRAGTAVRIGPPPVAESYLQIPTILEAARKTGADAIHPGYGLLSENAAFAAACESSGIAFIGPTAEQMRAFGLKDRARALADEAGVPTCPGSGLLKSSQEAVDAARALGFPVLLKAAAGGGGIGMRLCHDAEETARELERVQRLAASHFGNGDVFLEKYLMHARHIEVQIFGDGAGNVVALGERDCSLQRRHQKVFEEAPAPGVDPSFAAEMHAAAVALARTVQYRSAGTVEFLADPAQGIFYFLEVNTRLQVEHGVTEAITGIDLVEWMIRLAGGDARSMYAYRHAPHGHAIEVRLYAEDPGRDFQPCTGVLTDVHFPSAARVDTWIQSGTEVTPFYDPLLAKVVVHGADRAAALQQLAAVLDTTRLAGVQTNLPYARAITRWNTFARNRHHTAALEAFDFEPETVEVVTAGVLTTVQDYPGRLGYWDVGVPPSGPMDWLAFRLGNRILGNADGTAGLELTVRGPHLRFRRATQICLTGARIDAKVDGKSIPMWEAVTISADTTLDLGMIAAPGARSYLLMRGGIDVPAYLGSRATFTLGGFGGHGGRALHAGDALPLGDPASAPDSVLSAAAAAALAPSYGDAWELRVVHGPHANPEFFTDTDIDGFYGASFTVHHQSARTGVRLIGPKPGWARHDGGDAGLHPSNIHDTAYSVGAVDFTGDMPVILGPDGPSLGGFVCPAVTIHADRWKLGQLRPGDRVRFRAVSADAADEIDREQERLIATRDVRAVPIVIETSTRIESGATRRTPKAAYRLSGDRDVLIEYGPMTLDLELRIRVQLLLNALRERIAAGDLRGIIDLTPGVRSLQIHFDPSRLPRNTLLARLEELEDGLPTGDAVSLPTRIVHMPLSWDDPQTRLAIETYMKVVRPDAPWCPDNIEFIRRINGLDSVEDVKRIVYSASYLVLGLGDVYLGAPVATPIDPRHRLVTTKYNPARTWTPENAVGIGGAYMCIYGMEGPGGYQFVGRTVPVWSTYPRWPHHDPNIPWLLRFFDQIHFFPIDAKDLLDYRRGVRDGSIALRIEDSRFDIAEYHRFVQANRADIDLFRTRQQAAFRAERERWRESGELEAAGAAEGARSEEAGIELEIDEGLEIIAAPLGAQVLRIEVGEGATVAIGDDVAVLSAMKTEIAVHATVAGRVERVVCKVGDVLAAGAAMFVVRPASSPFEKGG